MDKRKEVESDIIRLWLSLNNLLIEELTNYDLDVWEAITKHPAIQEKLK